MELFDPVKITNFVTLAGAAIWAVCYMREAGKVPQMTALIVTIIALGTTACLEWTKHVDPCAAAPKLLLNEICAEGSECEGGKDFVEIYNPTGAAVDLGCYALMDQRSSRKGERIWANPFFLPGGETIAAGQVRAWDENELGFRISRADDRVALTKLQLKPGEKIALPQLDIVTINGEGTYLYRLPDGDNWKAVNHEGAKAVGSFGKLNGKK
jgi:hypothetical protein